MTAIGFPRSVNTTSFPALTALMALESLMNHGPNRAHRLHQRRQRIFATLMLFVILVNKCHQRSGIHQDHRRFFLFWSKISRNFSPVRTERSGGPPRTQPTRCAIKSYGGCLVSPLPSLARRASQAHPESLLISFSPLPRKPFDDSLGISI